MNQQNVPQNMNYNVLPTSTLATVSMISGILGFTLFPLIGTIIAIWTGYEARKETRSVPPRASGDGMATAGIVMGWIQVGLFIVSICCAIAYFLFVGGLIFSSGGY